MLDRTYYAHNEMEWGIWRAQFCQKLKHRVVVEAYWNCWGPAEPEQEWLDRNRLYSLKYNPNCATGDQESVTREIQHCARRLWWKGLGLIRFA